MISSHSINQIFTDPDLSPKQRLQVDRIIEAARAYGSALVEVCPQSPGLETALRYAQMSMFLAAHSITNPL